MPKKRVGSRPVKSSHEKLNPVGRLIIVLGQERAQLPQAQTDEERDYRSKRIRAVERMLRRVRKPIGGRSRRPGLARRRRAGRG